MCSLYCKRIFDIIISIALLAFLSPILIVIVIMLSISNQGHAFFSQMRTGKHAELFKELKFRSMNCKRDSQGKLLPDNQRLTKAGIFLRNTSLDELPQLINVIIGDMSLVGPRPLMEDYLPLYSDFQNRRHDVLPGITGWVQINGRNAIGWSKKFEYDIWYVDNQSFRVDLKVLFMTFTKVWRRDGINQTGNENPIPFKGVDENQP
jgi:undecaprenyl phosphate N,N'-diacetylbacillosamine 1-phosphate transferase